MHAECERSCAQRLAISVAMSDPSLAKDQGGYDCKDWAANGECSKNPLTMLTVCGGSCVRAAEEMLSVREGRAEL